MANSGIQRSASRLRVAVWVLWGCIVAAYAVARLGLSLNGSVQVRAHVSDADSGTPMIIADATVLLISVALYQLTRMLGAVAEGDLFSARVVGAFRAFAFWLLLVALVWVVAPILFVLVNGPGEARHLAFRVQLRDILTIGVSLILFLVARLLERARVIDEEMQEIV